MTGPLGVALVGVGADQWSGVAHLPALSATPGVELVRIVTSSPESARRAQEIWRVPASDTLHDVLSDEAVDVVTITVRVAQHFEIAAAAISAGKHVYCEWPLGVDTGQAHELAALSARHPERMHVVGLQGRLGPEIRGVEAAVAAGRLGRPLRASLHVYVPQALQARPKHRAHLRHRSAAANVLSIQGGHALDMLATVLGPPGDVSFARVWTAVDEFMVLETGERLIRDAPDNVVAQLELGGVPVTVQLSQTATRAGSMFEVFGTTASVLLAASDQPQMSPLDVTFTDLGQAPESWLPELDEDTTALDRAHVGYGVALAYGRIGRALREGHRDATLATFADAVVAHDLIDAIERAADADVLRLTPRTRDRDRRVP